MDTTREAEDNHDRGMVSVKEAVEQGCRARKVSLEGREDRKMNALVFQFMCIRSIPVRDA